MIEREEADEFLDRYAYWHQKTGGCLPILIEAERYEFMGNPVKITSSNVYDEIGNAEVLIESRSGYVETVEMSSLTWRYGRRLVLRMASGESEYDIFEAHPNP